MPKRLLLLSNSTNKGEAFLSYPKTYIENFLGKKIKKILFIPYAGVTLKHNRYSELVSHAFSKMGYQTQSIHEVKNPKQAIQHAQAIVVGGGNTFHLLTLLYKNNLIEAIREKIGDGTPYIGWSAGSNVACPSIKTTNDMPIIEPPSFEALNLIPFQINPHYTEDVLPNHGGESRKQRLEEFLDINPDIYTVGLAEGTAIQVETEIIHLLGDHPAKVFKKNNPIREVSAKDSLDFLFQSN